MLVFAWCSVATLGAVFILVCALLAAVEISERRRLRQFAQARVSRPGFRPVVITGGQQGAPVKAVRPDKLAG